MTPVERYPTAVETAGSARCVHCEFCVPQIALRPIVDVKAGTQILPLRGPIGVRIVLASKSGGRPALMRVHSASVSMFTCF